MTSIEPLADGCHLLSGCASESSPLLPGYQAQLNENGVDHSKRKLQEAQQDLFESAAAAAADCLASGLSIECRPCRQEDETVAYRCSCTFQLVATSTGLQYAMRHRKKPVLVGAPTFPIANRRIQSAMRAFLMHVNRHTDDGKYGMIKKNLTSISFASSWTDTPTSDCMVTLHYDSPLDAEKAWASQAQMLCNELSGTISKLTGRAKKQVVTVSFGDEVLVDVIRDTLWMYRGTDGRIERIALQEDRTYEDSATILVRYEKPETAFYHPNASVMIQALQWMVSQLHKISKEIQGDVRLLELYCGCGAHTVALASTGLLDVIVAVELDARLIDACRRNCRLNSCEATVHIFQGDAGVWARRALLARQRREQESSTAAGKSSAWYSLDFQILLVDPPRVGLDETVCRMASDEGFLFQHILYISCGRKALLRDLARLRDHFEVTNCTLLDLFPRTDSVESLVHLTRRKRF
jgi:tRNA/tmRNA/rRNA uracil-C5-methylase (TrmA/RlmC/RlmD family)